LVVVVSWWLTRNRWQWVYAVVVMWQPWVMWWC
jgi:hypothetical protein